MGEPEPDRWRTAADDGSRRRLGCAVMKPVARRRYATGCRAVQMIDAALVLPDVDHPSADYSVTQNTDPAVVKRLPFPEGVGFLENSQLFIERDVSVHDIDSRTIFCDPRN